MKYLLDTSALSDFVKGEANTLHHIKTTSPAEISVSSISIMEVQYGLALNEKQAKIIKPILIDFLTTIPILNFNQDDASRAGVIRAALKQQGQLISPYDILLAGTALNHNLTLITSNLKEFTRINGLKLTNWRNSKHP